MLTVSWTATVVTPMICLVSRVTSVVVRWRPSAVAVSAMERVPGMSGRYGLSIVAEKADGSIVGEYGSTILIGPALDAPAVDVETVGGAVEVPGADEGPPLHAAARTVKDAADATAATSRARAYSIWIIRLLRELWRRARRGVRRDVRL